MRRCNAPLDAMQCYKERRELVTPDIIERDMDAGREHKPMKA